MWKIFESHKTRKSIRKLPIEILKRYEVWKQIVVQSGPQDLRLIKGFRDEALKGIWKGYRSSRLNRQYRVIYYVKKDQLYVEVIDINAHDYRK